MESRSLFVQGFSGYQKLGNMYRRMVVPGIVKNCRKLITVSESEKKRIADFFKLDDRKIEAVYNGVSSHFKQVTDTAELFYLKHKYKLPDRFFLFFGNTDPKKNTRGVLQAFSLFLKGSEENTPLVILDLSRNELARLVQDLGDPLITDHIILTGYIPNNELPGIYSLSTVFLYPSLRESFGIPILEAMACGVPVITSNTSSMPEVGGDAALFIDPYTPGQITDAMKRVLYDHKLRSGLIEKGFINASKFSWTAMARHIHRIYQDIYQDSEQ
jgi:glycosyltransferase involved in cell wall biosynthesis